MPEPFSLDDKYVKREGRVAMTGIQALVRLPLDQARLDRAAGHRIGTFITGYQGSPLGEYDKQLGRAARHLAEHDVIWQPGLNEEVAATALYGAQLLEHFPHERFDGVVSIWYGKSPGVDRTGDAFRHANFLGTGRMGAAVALAGDDIACKSSTIPGDSTISFYDLAFPVLYPGNPEEVLSLGLHAIAMSRYSGLWSALKIVTNVADGGAIVTLAPPAAPIVPHFEIDGRAFRKQQDHRLLPPFSVEMERQIVYERTAAALAYAKVNRLDRITLSTPEDRVGLVAAGKTYYDLMHALDLLGLGEEELHRAGIRIYKLGLIAPLEEEGLRAFAAGLSELVVVEDKRGFIETQVREALYNLSARPKVFGKRDGHGDILFAAHGELSADGIAVALADFLAERLRWPALRDRAAPLRVVDSREYGELMARTPYFCSGCPHNTSTKLPEGSEQAGGGIGCHAMATWMDRGIAWLPQMGGEGACWMGLAPFTEKEHVFQNVGDGTFAHSASKSFEACVAAKVNITFRILYNAAVAMTGGQEVVGLGTPSKLARQLAIQGARKVVVITQEFDAYPHGELGQRIEVRPREDYDDVMRELRDIPGVTVIIFDQQCAAEKRRERKRGTQEAPRKRVYINESVCEGCGDCATQSNCLSVVPVNTPLGRKTKIHQGSCNLDYSCLKGDCPSFMTVRWGDETEPKVRGADHPLPENPPEPALPDLTRPYKTMLIGIGGTGVVTVDALLVTAALLDGREALHLDQTGLSQKGGAVLSNLVVADRPIRHGPKIAAGEADAVLAFDLLAAAAPDNLRRFSAERTQLVGNTARTSTAQLVMDPAARYPSLEDLQKRLAPYTRAAESHWIDAEAACETLFGNSATSNVFLLGVAYQRGCVPLRAASIERAIEANGVAIEDNQKAFRWGRVAVADPEAFAAVENPPEPSPQAAAKARLERFAPHRRRVFDELLASSPEGLEEVLAARLCELLLFQGEKLARRYMRFVVQTAQVETAQGGGRSGIAEAVARGHYKLLAIKDEYEVARLWLQDPLFEEVAAAYEGPIRRKIHLHPPLLRRLGSRKKLVLGEWVTGLFRVLYALRRVRGTPLDIFGFTKHRRMERSLAPWYESLVRDALAHLNPGNHGLLRDLASLPEMIRGYEEIKERNVAHAREEAERLLDKLRTPTEIAGSPE
ncbi:MAG: indolepyruvate ferredoxin oxidoreductase family protein [Myxococcales bacterium]|nr:indolepyruvate ferredoxin oxidoreductase family protein [Myxococcales bacterium]